MARPVLYLDVDGVVNFIKHPRKGSPYEWDDIERAQVASPIEGDDRTFKITYSKTLSLKLLELEAYCDIEWLTTWGHEANTHISPLIGLPQDLKVTGTVDDYRAERDTGQSGLVIVNSYNWKLETIKKDQNENPRPFIWADDNAIDYPAREWLANLDEVPWCTIIPTHIEGGLNPTHIMYMREFIQAVREREEV